HRDGAAEEPDQHAGGGEVSRHACGRGAQDSGTLRPSHHPRRDAGRSGEPGGCRLAQRLAHTGGLMTILLDRSTPVLVLGITGKIGSFHTPQMIAYGTNVVGGVTPGKGGTSIHNVPVFDTIKEAVDRTGATAAIVFVP